MRKRSMTKSTTKLLALMIAMVMVLGMVPGMVVAQDSEPQDVKAVQDEKQIVSNGKIVTKTQNDVSVEFSKLVEATGKENEFNITFEIVATEKVEDIEMPPEDAVVVLVLDISGSMFDNSIEGVKRFEIMKAAAVRFIENYANLGNYSGNEEIVRALSVVSFRTDAFRTQNWVNVADGDVAETVIGIVNGLTSETYGGSSRGTNVTAGLRLAHNLLNVVGDYSATGEGKKDWDDIENVHVILLSDGGPTAGSKAGAAGFDTSIEKIESNWGNNNLENQGIATYKGFVDEVMIQANLLAEMAEVHAIGFTTLTQVIYDDKAGDSLTTNQFLTKIAGDEARFYGAENGKTLDLALKAITDYMTIGADAWTVEDLMGEHIEFLHLLDADGNVVELSAIAPALNVTRTEVDGVTKLVWDIKSEEAESIDGNKFRYTKTYTIRLCTEDIENAEDAMKFLTGVATNGDTTLEYVFIKDGDIDFKGTGEFEVPVVKGYTTGDADGFSFQKVDDKGNAIAGEGKFEFTLTDNCGHDENVLTAKTDKDGKISFENIPSGHQYILTETDGDANYYIDSDKKYDVSVDYGVVTLLDKEEKPVSDGFKFENTPYISLDKSVSNKSTTVSSTVKYTLKIKNNGFINLENVVIKDEMFAKAEGEIEIKKGDNVLESADYTISEDGTAITLTKEFAKDEEITVTYYVKFTTTGPFDNTAEVTGKEVDGQRTVGAKDTETVTVTTGGGDTTPTTSTTASETTEKKDDTTAPPTTTEPKDTEPTTAAPTTSLPTDPTEVIGETIPEPPTPGAGQTLVPSEDGYELIDEDGTPLGKWTYDPELEEWVFDEYDIPLGSLPNTGAAMSLVPYFLVGATGGLVVLRARKAKREDEE